MTRQAIDAYLRKAQPKADFLDDYIEAIGNGKMPWLEAAVQDTMDVPAMQHVLKCLANSTPVNKVHAPTPANPDTPKSPTAKKPQSKEKVPKERIDAHLKGIEVERNPEGAVIVVGAQDSSDAESADQDLPEAAAQSNTNQRASRSQTSKENSSAAPQTDAATGKPANKPAEKTPVKPAEKTADLPDKGKKSNSKEPKDKAGEPSAEVCAMDCYSSKLNIYRTMPHGRRMPATK